MTTSYVDKQAYSEVVEDGHPILIVTASDIAGILRHNSINTSNIDYYLRSIDEENDFIINRYKVQQYEQLKVAEELVNYKA